MYNAKYGLAYSSGEASIHAVTHLVAPHQRLISVDCIYGGTA